MHASICVGKRLAELTIFTTIAMVLATFDILKSLEENGNEITPVVDPRKSTTDEFVRYSRLCIYGSIFAGLNVLQSSHAVQMLAHSAVAKSSSTDGDR